MHFDWIITEVVFSPYILAVLKYKLYHVGVTNKNTLQIKTLKAFF